MSDEGLADQKRGRESGGRGEGEPQSLNPRTHFSYRKGVPTAILTRQGKHGVVGDPNPQKPTPENPKP